MCQQQIQAQTQNNNKMKNSYSIKQVLRTLFKKQQKQQQKEQQNLKLCSSLASLEFLDNLRNTQVEQNFYSEQEDNTANEKLADLVTEQQDDIYVPVRFARTEAGTFFWTTNLQPVTSTIVPAADEDLLQPAYCYSNKQYPHIQFQDRWAQA